MYVSTACSVFVWMCVTCPAGGDWLTQCERECINCVFFHFLSGPRAPGEARRGGPLGLSSSSLLIHQHHQTPESLRPVKTGHTLWCSLSWALCKHTHRQVELFARRTSHFPKESPAVGRVWRKPKTIIRTADTMALLNNWTEVLSKLLALEETCLTSAVNNHG